MPSQSVYTTTHHLDHPSVFHNMQVPDDPAQLEAIHLWELTADSKYIDIKGYGYCRLIKSVAPRECARLEIDKINLLLETGECDFFTGYLDDLDLVQIPFCNQALVTGRWDCFISLKETQRYLNSEQDDLTLNDYFSKRWIVATQVQALIWYKLYLLDVVENGLQVRDPDNNVNQDTNKLTQLVNYFVLKGEFWEITAYSHPS